MKRIYWYLIVFLPLVYIFSVGVLSVEAHRSGCHRWHSCPSDSGSYVCGDTGHSNYCGSESSGVTVAKKEHTFWEDYWWAILGGGYLGWIGIASMFGDKKDKKSTGVTPLCPTCRRPMVRRTGKRGAFWGCVGYPSCRGTRKQ
ncbi:MAG: topoisomerase DNA-binding C4 zinc finger domain-containing protein [bacterium]